jgi:DNA-binding transcriptional regulator YdaS (Cro superfamily)
MINPGLKAAVDAAGGFRPLARAIGIDHRAVMGWDKIPAARLLVIEEKFNVKRHELRPDLFAGYVEIGTKNFSVLRPSKKKSLTKKRR